MDVKIVVDGKEVALVANGSSKHFDRFKEPDGLPGGEEGKSPLIANVYVKKGWEPPS